MDDVRDRITDAVRTCNFLIASCLHLTTLLLYIYMELGLVRPRLAARSAFVIWKRSISEARLRLIDLLIQLGVPPHSGKKNKNKKKEGK
jgi:hypothetical protein